MAFPTRLMGVNDLSLQGWKILDLSALAGTAAFGRHIFGYCQETGYYQVSSAILEENDDWIRTRSRKYFKIGPCRRGWGLSESLQFIGMMQGWGLGDEEINRLMDDHR